MSSKASAGHGRALALTTLAVILLPRSAYAQDSEPVDIEVGTRRVGGPGTASERKADAAYEAALEEEATPMTEETLPPKGDKKRLPGLHKLAKQYFGGRMWKDACDKYDQLIEEGGDESLDLVPEGKTNAARSFYECAQLTLFSGDHDRVEKLLKKSERYAPSDHRHAAVRRKITREQFRKSMANGDVNNALTLFKKYQAEQADEDERIWMGEELAKLAWNAYQTKDRVALKELIRQTEEVAPMNTELRRLKKKIEGEENVFTNIAIWGAVAVAFVLIAKKFSTWRARAKVRRFSSGVFPPSGDADKEV